MPSVLGIDITTEAEAKRAAEAKKKYYGYMKQRGMYVKLLQDIKKKYNWTDKDLKDKGLWNNAIMDPYIKYLSESNIKMAGGKTPLPSGLGLPEAVIVTPAEAASSGEPGPDAAAIRAIDNATNAAEAILNDPRISSSSSAADVQNIAASRSLESGTRARQMTLLEEKAPPIYFGDIFAPSEPSSPEQKAQPSPPVTTPPRGTKTRPKKKGPSQRKQILTNILGSEPSGTGSIKLKQVTDEILRDNPMPADWESNREYQDKITKALQDTTQYKNYVESRKPVAKRPPVIKQAGQPAQRAPPEQKTPPPNLREIAMNKIAQKSDVDRIYNDVEQRARQRIADIMTNNLTEAQRNAIIDREFKRNTYNKDAIKQRNEFGTKLTVQNIIDDATREVGYLEDNTRAALDSADAESFNQNKNRPSPSSSSSSSGSSSTASSATAVLTNDEIEQNLTTSIRDVFDLAEEEFRGRLTQEERERIYLNVSKSAMNTARQNLGNGSTLKDVSREADIMRDRMIKSIANQIDRAEQSARGEQEPVRAPDPSRIDILNPMPSPVGDPTAIQYPETYEPSKDSGVKYPVMNPPLRGPDGVLTQPINPNNPPQAAGGGSVPPRRPAGQPYAVDDGPEEKKQGGGGGPIPPFKPPQPEPDQPERKEPIPRERPIPLPPKEEPQPPKRKPPKEEPPKEKTTKDTNLPQGVKNQGGYGYLRPFFDDYHGIDLLTQTEAESLEDIREFELFDVPIDPNQNLNNPVFVAWLRNQQLRFSGYGIDPNFHKSAQLAAIREENAQLNGDKDIYSNVRPTYNSFMEAEPILQEPTPIWYDPYNHDRPRGVGVFSEAYRTESSEAFAWAAQTNIHPDLVQMTKYKPDAPFNIQGSISNFVRPVVFHEPGGMSANA